MTDMWPHLIMTEEESSSDWPAEAATWNLLSSTGRICKLVHQDSSHCDPSSPDTFLKLKVNIKKAREVIGRVILIRPK